MKSRISAPRFRRAFNCVILCCVLLSAPIAGNVISVRAAGESSAGQSVTSQSRDVILAPATVPVLAEIQNAVVVALENAAGIAPNTTYFAITDLRRDGDWAVASVIGLAQVHEGLRWSMDDGSWVGLVLLKRLSDGHWTGAAQGTPPFSSLMDASPDTFVDKRAKQNLDPLRQPSIQIAGTYTFPWQGGTAMLYGSEGVHDNGFSGVVTAGRPWI